LRIASGSTIESNVKASVRYAAVAIGICSWVAVSNHCAFAMLAPKTHSHAACPFHSNPAKQKQQSSDVQCCKTLRAVALGKSKTWARDDGKFSDVEPRIEELALNAHRGTAQSGSFFNTGPPDAHSFAELILQRSLLAHAPPFLV